MKRLLSVILALTLFPLLFTGCQKEDTPAGKVIRYPLSSDPQQLDPQMATSYSARLVLRSCLEGLTRVEADGSVSPGAAARWDCSPDGLTYTFYLRQDAIWYHLDKEAPEYPVTAHDFVFAIQRALSPEVNSPAASSLYLLKNAKAVHEGSLSADRLGVRADGDYVLILELEHADPDFPATVSGGAWLPCSEQFFLSTGGKYGLTASALAYNGPFYISSWEKGENIRLSVNPRYRGSIAPTPAGVSFTVYDEDGMMEAFTAGKLDAAPLSGRQYVRLNAEEYSAVSFEDTVWALCFNGADELTSDLRLRQSLCQSIEREGLSASLPEYLTLSDRVIPAAAFAEDLSRSFESPLPAFSPAQAKERLNAFLADRNLSSLPKINLYCPDDHNVKISLGLLLQSWQKHLAVYINLVPVSEKELTNRINTGDYQIAVVPLRPSSDEPGAALSLFSSGSLGNPFGGTVNDLDDVLARLASQSSADDADSLLSEGQRLICQSCAAYPLYQQKSYFVSRPGVSGISFFPFGEGVDFLGAGRVDS
ncbi:MAG: peptide ABC transporter substrate-binding protein [Clostridiales bacterium]|nr:peptide ABC transporter substrate-binding protein [Clostridiales bacterium]